MSQAYRVRDPVVTTPQNMKLKFEVEEIGPYKRTQRVGKRATDGITKGLVFSDEAVEYPGAWVVYFPSGHSIRVESIEEMQRLGYMEPPPVIDMETGEEVMSSGHTLSPKEVVKRATAERRSIL
jgi:hypothetical protein